MFPSSFQGRNFMEHTPPTRSTSAGRSSVFVRTGQIAPPTRPSFETSWFYPTPDRTSCWKDTGKEYSFALAARSSRKGCHCIKAGIDPNSYI
ncbi:hypothetical protein L6452_02466 [Arctium lappa]|uniref:Uncharacterized protein n=1 Tax=Arctium lappa TaxID=4217 RepID=A0ACB9FJM3_ARCLA|nr:hypothetical protein L6452_02466 [Arctium lappa]